MAFLIGFSMRANADDWIIEVGESETMGSDKTVNGMVIIEGTLTIESGVTLEIDNSDMSYGIYVRDTGILIMKDSAKITATGGNNILDIKIDGTVDITNCEINGLEGGIIFTRSSVVTNFSGTLKNCNVGLVRKGIDEPADDSVTFNNVNHEINQYWYVKITITNGDGGKIEDAEVKIKNKNDLEVGSDVTGLNGWADFGAILVRQDATNYNDFKIYIKAHKDDEDNYHITPIPTTHTINDNYESVEITINEALNPDFSIRNFHPEKSPMTLEETNKLTVIIRNLGEKTSTASIKFYAKKGGEDYKSIKDKEEDIPAETSDYEAYCDWKPTEAGYYDIKVEVEPKTSADQYPGDDKSPQEINVNVLQPPEIEIDTPNEGSTVGGMVEVEGTYEGSEASIDYIRVWLNDDTKYTLATYDNEDWSCELDTGAYNGANQIIHVIISSDGEMFFDEDEVNVTLQNEPEVTIDYPINNAKLVAKEQNHKIIISGEATKKSPLAPDIESVELKICGELQSVNLVKKNDTRWTWLFEWYIALTNDGIYEITARSEDNSQRKSDIVKITVTVDNQPPYSMITIPKIEITTQKPTEPVKEEILIKGNGEDDWEIKRIEAKVDKGDWFTIISNINQSKYDWEYNWVVDVLTIGNHTINFRALDEEEDENIIKNYYPVVSFTINKQLSIETIPKIEIVTNEPTESVKDEILIRGNAEDDKELKKIEAKIDNGDWFTIKSNINTKNYNWEYKWNINELYNGRHTIYFRAVDKENNESIIQNYYQIVSFSILKNILPDLGIETIKIMQEGEEITKAKNKDELTFEIKVKVDKANEILKPTKIYVKLAEEEKSLNIITKTIDNIISESFTVTISWVVYGSKGEHNYSIEIDKGNYLEEENEDNNVKIVQIEILDDPTSLNEGESEKESKESSKVIYIIPIIGVIIVMGIIFIFSERLNHSKNKTPPSYQPQMQRQPQPLQWQQYKKIQNPPIQTLPSQQFQQPYQTQNNEPKKEQSVNNQYPYLQDQIQEQFQVQQQPKQQFPSQLKDSQFSSISSSQETNIPSNNVQIKPKLQNGVDNNFNKLKEISEKKEKKEEIKDLVKKKDNWDEWWKNWEDE